MTSLWLTLARIGEQAPFSSEHSYTANERAVWERVAAYVTAQMGDAPDVEQNDDGQAWVERSQGRALLNALKNLETGEPCCGPEFKAQWFVSARSGLYKATLEPSSPDMRRICYEKRRERPPLSASGTSEMRSTDQAYCDALLDESIREAADATFEGRAYKGRTGGRDYYEQEEAGGVAERTKAAGGDQSPTNTARLTTEQSGRDAAGSNPVAPASPSLPPWPARFQGMHHPDAVVVYAREADAWRDAALAEIERLKADLTRISERWNETIDRCIERGERIAALERDLAEARNLKSAALQEMAEIERAHDKRYELMEELERDLAEAKRPRCDYHTERIVINERFAAIEARLAALERHADDARNMCERHGVTLYIGPPDCPMCGAPNCCPKCCKEALEENKSEGAASSNAPLGARAPAVTSCAGSDTPSDPPAPQALEGERARLGSPASGSIPDPATTPSDPPTAWTEEQRWAMRDVIRSVTSNRPIGFDPDRVCAEIAKHAHLFAKRTISAEEFRVFCHAYTMDEQEEIEDSLRAALSAIGIEVKP